MAAEQEAEINLEEGGEESTSRGAKNKRKRSEPRDPNAPKRPSSAYIYFSTEMRLKIREEKQEMSMSERAKYIGKLWAAISKEEKKKYQDVSDKDKERYIHEYLAYQETETYKQFMRNKHPALKKSRKDGEKKSTSAPAPAKLPLSCQQQFIPGSNIPIFSDQFLVHNRDLESQLRKLRQSSANLEEENALLSRHVDSMKVAVERVQNEVQKQEEKNAQMQTHLSTIREVLTLAFKDIAIPNSNERPTVGSIDGYIGKLKEVITIEPEKHPVLVEKVAIIANQLEMALKEKLTRGFVESIIEKKGWSEGEVGRIEKAPAVTDMTEEQST